MPQGLCATNTSCWKADAFSWDKKGRISGHGVLGETRYFYEGLGLSRVHARVRAVDHPCRWGRYLCQRFCAVLQKPVAASA